MVEKSSLKLDKKALERKSLSSRLKDPLNLVLLIFGFIGVTGTIFTIYSYVFTKPVKRLDFLKLSYVSLIPKAPVLNEIKEKVEVQVLLNGKKLDDLKQVVFAFKNNGNEIITKSREQPLYLQFPSNTKILSTEILNLPNEDMFFKLEYNEEENQLFVDFDMLKPRETIAIAALLQGELPDELPKIRGRIEANIREVSQISNEMREQNSRSPSRSKDILSELLLIIFFPFMLFLAVLLLTKAIRVQGESSERMGVELEQALEARIEEILIRLEHLTELSTLSLHRKRSSKKKDRIDKD